MPAIMAMGYIAAFSERLAMSVIDLHCVDPLADALVNEKGDPIRVHTADS